MPEIPSGYANIIEITKLITAAISGRYFPILNKPVTSRYVVEAYWTPAV